jgi:hypothetical protein
MIPVRPPSQAEATRGRDYLAPGPATAATIRSWRPFRNPAGTILGFLSIELPSGLVINDAKLMVGTAGKHWIALPAIKQIGKDGEPRVDDNGRQLWSPIVEFATRDARDRFSELILAALRRQHPGAFDPTVLPP